MLALALTLASVAASGPPDADGWAMVWSDEFDGHRLDPRKWRAEESCWGGGNDERQCYTKRRANIRVAGGLLHLHARAERLTGPDRPAEIAANPNPRRTQPFTSGKVRTRGLASWRYGRIEFRAKPPRGQGTWPAVWMMPAADHYGGWPRSGEIDILEGVNLGALCTVCTGSVGENRMLSAIHFGDYRPGNRHHDQRVALPDGRLPSDDFHVWRMDWGRGLMRFYLDGRLYWERRSSDWSSAAPNARGNPNAPFDQPFYLMANLAIGGRLAEDHNTGGVAADVVPATFQIDWIRIYQCAPDRDTGLACMKGSGRGE